MLFKAKTLDDTKRLAYAFVQTLDDVGLFATLLGDIGAGKTQFIRFVLEYLEVEEKVTSPSFVILNEYKSPRFKISHFDLYRLEKTGLKTITEELREYSKVGYLTFVEWAEFGYGEIPADSLKIEVLYDEEDIDIRLYKFSGNDKKTLDFIEKLLYNIIKNYSYPTSRRLKCLN